MKPHLICREIPGWLLAVGLTVTCFASALTAAARPNVVIFLADDSGWGDYGFTGHTQSRTPNIDSIARPPGESKMKEFRSLNLGTMRLENGRGLLTLRALKIPGLNVMDVRQVNLTLRASR